MLKQLHRLTQRTAASVTQTCREKDQQAAYLANQRSLCLLFPFQFRSISASQFDIVYLLTRAPKPVGVSGLSVYMLMYEVVCVHW